MWILLQPRDYLSSFLLYAMLALAVIAVVIAHPSMDSMPVLQSAECTTPVFPVLFTTIACGAISGFHSLVSSGTTSKQLDKETDAKPIAYGGMLLECVLAVLVLCAVAGFANANGGDIGVGPTVLFGGGIAGWTVRRRGDEDGGGAVRAADNADVRALLSGQERKDEQRRQNYYR